MHVRVFFLDWETTGQHYFNDVSISSQTEFYLHVHVLYRSKEMPSKLLPRFRCLHVPNKTIVMGFDSVNWELIARKLTAKNPRLRFQEKRHIILVSSDPNGCFGPLIELLNAKEVQFKTVTTKESTALDQFPVKCVKCRMIFQDKKERKKHDNRFCGFFDECLTGLAHVLPAPEQKRGHERRS